MDEETMESIKPTDLKLSAPQRSTGNLCPHISASTSDEVIQIDPPELCFPLVRDKNVLSSVKVINITELYVSISLSFPAENSAMYFTRSNMQFIMPPRSTQWLTLLMRKETEDAVKDMQFSDQVLVWYAILAEGSKVSDLDLGGYKENKKLPVVLTKISASTSDEVIQIDPPELCFPLVRDKNVLSSVKVINITELYVSISLSLPAENSAMYFTRSNMQFIMPPRSTQWLTLIMRKETEDAVKDMQFSDQVLVWYAIVAEGSKVSDLDLGGYKENKKLPVVLTKINSGTGELIQFDPPELSFPCLNKTSLSSVNMVNNTDCHIGFNIWSFREFSACYETETCRGILAPRSTHRMVVQWVPKENEAEEDMQCKKSIFVWNMIVAQGVESSRLRDHFIDEDCKELPFIFNKTSSSILDELIQFDPPELHFPILPNKKVLSSIKIENLTDYNVGFNTYSRPTNAARYHTEPPRGILPPRSTQKLMVTREEKEDALEDKQFNEKYFVWTSILSEGVKDNELCDYMDDQESKELPIVLDKISSLTSDKLIQLDPAELCMPHWPNKHMKFIVNVVNTTDFYVAFNVYVISRNAARDKESTANGILPPQSSKRQILYWLIEETEPREDYFVWSRVVTEGVESIDIIGYMVEEESKKLPFILNKASPCTSNELIQFDPPELSLPSFMPNKPLVFSVNLVNNTDHYVGFDRCNLETNVFLYYIEPAGGVMAPRSTQRLVVKRVPKKKVEQEDMQQCQDDKFLVWSCLVSEGAKASDLDGCAKYKGSKELPIVYTNKTSSLCTSDELIQFDRPQLPFLRTTLRLLKIVNVTDHIVGFSAWSHEDNSASYTIEPDAGILQPQSTQAVKVRRTPKKNGTKDIQCKDKIFVWNGIVTEGVQVRDVGKYWKDEDKVLPIVLRELGESSSR